MVEGNRKDPRARVLNMTVRYRSATIDEFIENHSHDISKGGMFIKTQAPFPAGTLLKFEVRIADEQRLMQGVGRVVWRREPDQADKQSPAGMGVKFIKMGQESKELITTLVSNRQGGESAFDVGLKNAPPEARAAARSSDHGQSGEHSLAPEPARPTPEPSKPAEASEAKSTSDNSGTREIPVESGASKKATNAARASADVIAAKVSASAAPRPPAVSVKSEPSAKKPEASGKKVDPSAKTVNKRNDGAGTPARPRPPTTVVSSGSGESADSKRKAAWVFAVLLGLFAAVMYFLGNRKPAATPAPPPVVAEPVVTTPAPANPAAEAPSPTPAATDELPAGTEGTPAADEAEPSAAPSDGTAAPGTSAAATGTATPGAAPTATSSGPAATSTAGANGAAVPTATTSPATPPAATAAPAPRPTATAAPAPKPPAPPAARPAPTAPVTPPAAAPTAAPPAASSVAPAAPTPPPTSAPPAPPPSASGSEPKKPAPAAPPKPAPSATAAPGAPPAAPTPPGENPY